MKKELNPKALERLGLTQKDFEKPEITQEEINTANIDYIAMMSDIELPQMGE